MAISMPKLSGKWWSAAKAFALAHYVWLIVLTYVARTKGGSVNPTDFFGWCFNHAADAAHFAYKAVAG